MVLPDARLPAVERLRRFRRNTAIFHGFAAALMALGAVLAFTSGGEAVIRGYVWAAGVVMCALLAPWVYRRR